MITTTDIINKLDKNNNVVVTKIRKIYNGSTIVKEQFLNSKDELHRDEDEPADIHYFNGKKCVSIWYKNGKKHRDEDKPALIRYNAFGYVFSEEWYQNDEIHRDGDQPGFMLYYKNEKIHRRAWYKHGKQYRDNDLPNCVDYDNEGNIISEKWYKDDKFHRPIENGPAIIEYNNNKIIKECYYLDGKLLENPINLINEIIKFSNEDILKCLEILKIMKK